MSFELIINPELNSANLYPVNFVKPIVSLLDSFYLTT